MNILKCFIVAFLVTTVVSISGLFGQDKTINIDAIIGMVGDNIVLKSDLETQYVQYLASGLPVNDNTKCRMIEDLLYQKLLIHQAEVDSVYVDETQIQGELDRRLRYFISQFGSEKKLEEYYHKSIPEIKDDFHDLIEEQLRVQTMQGKITEGIKVSPGDVRDYFNSLPQDSLPFINSEVQVAQIVKKPPVSEEEKERIKEKLGGIKSRIEKGEDFGTLAFMYSEDPGSSKKNGELGFMARDAFVPEFSAAAFSLKKNEMSGLVESPFGFHLIQMIDRRGDEANVRHILITPKVLAGDLQKAKLYLDSISVLINSVDTMSFELAASLFSDDKESKMNGGKIVNPQTGTSRIESDFLGQMDPTLFFTVDKMEEGQVSSPLLYQGMDGGQAYRIVKLNKRTDPHVANLKDDYSRIKEVALSNKQAEAIKNWMNKKISRTFVRVEDEFKDCIFEGQWLKQAN